MSGSGIDSSVDSQAHQVQSAHGEETATEKPVENLVTDPDPSMREYYRLQRELLVVAIALTGIIFVSTWVFYSLNTALNYMIGSCAGIFYLRLLAKHVEQIGRKKGRLGQTRLAGLIILIILASRLEQLEILPVFLGFLTYKASLIVYVVRIAVMPASS